MRPLTTLPLPGALVVVLLLPACSGTTPAGGTPGVRDRGTSAPHAAAKGPHATSDRPAATHRHPRRVTAVGAQTVGFASPAGDVMCSLGDDDTRCDVLGATFTVPPRPATCRQEWGHSVRLRPGRPAELGCTNEPAYVGGEFVLPSWWDGDKDPTVNVGGRTLYALGEEHHLVGATASCSVGSPGSVTCTSADGSHGFTLSRTTYRLW